MTTPPRSSPSPRLSQPLRSSDFSATALPRHSFPPRRFVPDDSLFTASYSLIGDDSSTDDDRYFKASTQLLTPVEAVQCTRMWIAAARLSFEHSTDEILQSLA
ncbi:unnamed protein product [Peronospora belbahrii]|uniref:HAT C-terminal dimerisation domain-containing protein n=1 Tax=Peronospora belbahrii TaxID=622444 RepID=A0AAU9KKI7_9STRA|nr:unnamed protein product [Peronospora belbahrii]